MKPLSSRARRLIVLIGVLLVSVAGIVLYDQWQTQRFYQLRLEPSLELQKVFDGPTNVPVAAQLDPSRPIRLAIGPLGLPAPADGQLADLVTAELSRAERFSLVERRELDRALQELELGFSGLVRAADAVKVGRLVRADWFLLGSPGRVETTTNAILARIVDARSSILRDVAIFQTGGNLSSLSGEVAAFIRRAAQVTTNATARTYLAIGGFEDLSINNRYAGFPEQVKAYLTTSYQGSTTTLVERELVNALLQEVRLDVAGLTVEGATNTPVPMQSAFWLVDGFYQSYEQAGPEIDLVLRVERVLGGRELVSLRGQPEEVLFRRAREAVDSTLAKGGNWLRWPGRRSEARLQLSRGIERSRLREDQLGMPLNNMGNSSVGGFNPSREPEKARKALEEAIAAFEGVLLLDPDDREAKLYLALCLTHPLMDRLDEARNYYREVIASPTQDGWGVKARLALGRSYWYEDPRRAFELFRDFAAQAKNTNHATWFRHEMQFVSNRGSDRADERIALAEEKVRERLDYVVKASQAYAYQQEFDLSGIARALPDRTDGVALLNRLLPGLLADYPTAKPHLLARAAALQLETNSVVVQQFRESLEWCAQHISEVSHPRSYFDELKESPFYWAFENRVYDLVIRLCEVGQLAARKGIIAESDDVHRIYQAFAYIGQERWHEALKVFEGLQTRSVKMSGNGPWGSYRHPYSAPAGAQWCRQKLGLPPAPSDTHTVLDRPVIETKCPLAFDLEGQSAWVGTGETLARFDVLTKATRKLPLPKDAEVVITAVCVGPDRVWVGAAGAGLFEVDKASGTVRQFTLKEGLLLDDISCFLLQGDRLWIGYGREGTGGLGHFNFRAGRFTSFTRPLTTTQVAAVRGRDGDLGLDAKDGPPRRRVTAMAVGKPEELWLAVPGKGLQRFSIGGSVWETSAGVVQPHLPHGDWNEAVTCVAADDRTLVVGRGLTISEETQATNALSLRLRGGPNWVSFSTREGLPSNNTSALAIRGNDLWVGGPGYVAVVALERLKVTRTFSFRGEGVKQLKLSDDSAWVSVDKRLFRIPLNPDGPLQRPAVSVPVAQPETR